MRHVTRKMRKLTEGNSAAAAVQIAVTSLTIILDIAEIILIARKRMQPALYLTSACIKTLIWGAFFIMSLISLSLLSIVLTVVLAYVHPSHPSSFSSPPSRAMPYHIHLYPAPPRHHYFMQSF